MYDKTQRQEYLSLFSMLDSDKKEHFFFSVCLVGISRKRKDKKKKERKRKDSIWKDDDFIVPIK